MKKRTKQDNKVLEMITNAYIFLIIVIFPLIVDKTGFFKILECKWRSYVAITTTYILCIIGFVIYYLIRYKKNLCKKKLSIIEWSGIVFLFVNILSYLFSPYLGKYNLLLGTGRGEGLIVSSLYILLVMSILSRHIT